MAYTSEFAQVGGVRIKIATGTYGNGTAGKSQTVNVFDTSNTEGNYREVYRIHDPSDYVTASQIEHAAKTLHDLDVFLLDRGAIKEGPRLK